MNNEPTKKYFDVAKPGNTAAGSGSRPIIVSNRPILQDPMMRDQTKPMIQPVSTITNTEAPVLGNDITKIASENSSPEVAAAQLTEPSNVASIVHIRGAKMRRMVSRTLLLVGALVAMAAVGYYGVIFLKK